MRNVDDNGETVLDVAEIRLAASGATKLYTGRGFAMSLHYLRQPRLIKIDTIG
jgi:hypothetical protein